MVLEPARVLTDATVPARVNAANALVAGVPRQAWKLGKSGSSRAKAMKQARPARACRPEFGAGVDVKVV